MVDRVYKEQLPALRRALEELRENFADLRPKTNWTALRIEPLLRHAKLLEHVLGSREFSGESSRLVRGVVFFHSDLVYLRKNVKGLKEILRSEKASLGLRNKKRAG